MKIVMSGMAIVHGVMGIVVLAASRPGYPDKSLGGFLCVSAVLITLGIIDDWLKECDKNTKHNAKVDAPSGATAE